MLGLKDGLQLGMTEHSMTPLQRCFKARLKLQRIFKANDRPIVLR